MKIKKPSLFLILMFSFITSANAENSFIKIAELEKDLAEQMQNQLSVVFGQESVEFSKFTIGRTDLYAKNIETDNEAFYSLYFQAAQQLSQALWGKQYSLTKGVHYEEILKRMETIHGVLHNNSELRPS
ncbi:MAG: hypothetical protein R3F02_02755 [Thiolinea sp.]